VTSSSGLSRYSPEGKLIHHYGEPFGLINNEFSPGLCSYSNDSQRTLLFGADSSLVKVNTHELVVSRLPDIQVIFSQIKRDQALYSLGNTLKERPSLGYQESITFQFGVLPRANSLNLEYRLNEGAEWQALDGTTLTIEHLIPGSYTLDVRALRNGVLQGQSNSYQFYVTEPWFMTNSAIVAYIVVLIVIIVSSVYWRSRIMSTANRELKAQIALKTNQLRHQSRILLTNNQQLRKQLQVRRLIFTQSVNALKEKLAAYAENGEVNSVLKQLSRELDLLASTRSTNGQALPVHNLTLIIQSALSGWTEEFSKAGVHVELEAENDLYVSLTHFNLDELFNLLFDGIVKRCYRNQTVLIQLSRRNDLIAFAMLDQGEELESDSILTSTLQSLRSLVEQSGGEMTSHISDERNLIEIAWQASDIFDEDSIVSAPSNQESAVFEDDDPWLEKVITLVEDNYTNAEFGTSAAAKMLFVSERSLQRRVKSATEKTFTEYLTEVRLDNACRRLLAGEKVSEVAFECGFNDPSYFSQRFKHRFGMPPTQFVEQQDRH
jgi:AraC family chitin signaling transcriptional activator